jgi:CDP-paratose 2-epimerase
MSCIYGPHQCGNEDQGWVAHFAKEAIAGHPITFYGDGRQVRDLLFVEDLVDAMEAAFAKISSTAGRAFNMGGGPANAVSLRQVIAILAEITGHRPQIRCDEWRQGDQKYYVSDTSAFERATGWKARISADEGIQRLCRWLQQHDGRSAQPTLAAAELKAS